MTPITTPVSMMGGTGKGTTLAVGVIGLLMLLVIASRRDPTAPKQAS